MITRNEFNENIDLEIKRISEWIKKTDSPLDSCQLFIALLVTEIADTHYEGVGLLTEALLEWRDINLKTLNDEA